ncbi:NADH dehydrogenase [ubiquinone] 1 beta subcomplex subunit 8, mitochondrial [Dendrobium catenatum]|uniref:NADH dehydrogenase [ubiquinone] 1 beta subcomplex subunit 8, mitochondrial n=1 Tax=Dendrobium catenatum TaxID=906689 RepID=A0A2I0W6U4_9ASPA|nr:NADH dehydrogenase [ubiquinone] 1 beta subcomplex subunit 8, mitochondrial [Dendrobium catenatum]
MAGRLSTAASRLLGGGGVCRSVAFSLPTRSGMGLPVGKHIVPDKPQDGRRVLSSSPCMEDPATEYGITWDEDGFTDILRSTFFDVNLEIDRTVEGYVERILFALTEAIDEHFEDAEWRISTSP